MTKIDLPRLSWLVSRHEGRNVTNIHSGSLGTASDQGCISTRTFNYRVYVGTSGGDERDFTLITEGFIIRSWKDGGKKTDLERAEFESSEKGISEAEEWLGRIAAGHGF